MYINLQFINLQQFTIINVIYFYNSKILTQDECKDTQYRLTISGLHDGYDKAQIL